MRNYVHKHQVQKQGDKNKCMNSIVNGNRNKERN